MWDMFIRKQKVKKYRNLHNKAKVLFMNNHSEAERMPTRQIGRTPKKLKVFDKDFIINLR